MNKEISIILNQEYIERICIKEILSLPEVRQILDGNNNPRLVSEKRAIEAKLFIEKEEIKVLITSAL